MFSEVLEKTKGLTAGDSRHCVAHSCQLAGGDCLIGTEPGIYLPGGSAESIPPLPPLFDGFLFIPVFATGQERDLFSSLL